MTRTMSSLLLEKLAFVLSYLLYDETRSLGALRAPTSSLWPFGPPFGPSGLLDFVLRALRALRPCDPRTVALGTDVFFVFFCIFCIFCIFFAFLQYYNFTIHYMNSDDCARVPPFSPPSSFSTLILTSILQFTKHSNIYGN